MATNFKSQIDSAGCTALRCPRSIGGGSRSVKNKTPSLRVLNEEKFLMSSAILGLEFIIKCLNCSQLVSALVLLVSCPWCTLKREFLGFSWSVVLLLSIMVSGWCFKFFFLFILHLVPLQSKTVTGEVSSPPHNASENT